jgi:hypothetical protein
MHRHSLLASGTRACSFMAIWNTTLKRMISYIQWKDGITWDIIYHTLRLLPQNG